MNIFMPEALIADSVFALDDKRLIKQILECYQIIRINERVLAGEEDVGYRNHPVVKFYRDKLPFVATYGKFACYEYYMRFCKHHQYDNFFFDEAELYGRPEIYDILYCEKRSTGLYENSVRYDVRNDIEPEDTHLMFRQKLIKKWDTDKRTPTWTNQTKPAWYSKGKE